MKFLHTMLRVKDLEKSLNFYCNVLDFKLIAKDDFKDGEFTLAFIQAPSDNGDGSMLELTYNWGVSSYEMGTAYGHVAFEVENIFDFQKKLQKHGHDLSWGPKKSPSGLRYIAFMVDPDGYKIELLEPRPANASFS